MVTEKKKRKKEIDNDDDNTKPKVGAYHCRLFAILLIMSSIVVEEEGIINLPAFVY